MIYLVSCHVKMVLLGLFHIQWYVELTNVKGNLFAKATANTCEQFAFLQKLGKIVNFQFYYSNLQVKFS